MPDRSRPDRLGPGDGHQRPDGASGCKSCWAQLAQRRCPQAQELDARIRAAVSLLVAAQNDDGGWSWTGPRRRQRALCHVAGRLGAGPCAEGRLPRARRAVPTRPSAWLQNEIVATADDDYESKAILLHALATVGKADFALANRLYRERQRLSAAALVYLALALAEMDRKPTAAELLDLLATRNLDDARRRADAAARTARCRGASRRPSCARSGRWPSQAVSPQSPKAKELVDWLLAHRVGHRWSPDKATGPATLALCHWFAESRFEGEQLHADGVRQRRAGQDAGRRSGGRHADDRRARRPCSRRKAGSGSISRSPAAGATPTSASWAVSCRPKSSKARPTTGRSTRTYEPAPLEVDGREVPRGFDVAAGQSTRVQESAHATARRTAADWSNSNIRRKNLPERRRRRATGISRRHRADPQRGDRHRALGPRRVRAVRAFARRDHVLRRQSPQRGADPLRSLRLSAGQLPRGADAWSATPIGPSNWPSPRRSRWRVLPSGAKSADPYRLTPRGAVRAGQARLRSRAT